jgi:hypothetical protein
VDGVIIITEWPDWAVIFGVFIVVIAGNGVLTRYLLRDQRRWCRDAIATWRMQAAMDREAERKRDAEQRSEDRLGALVDPYVDTALRALGDDVRGADSPDTAETQVLERVRDRWSS